MIGIFVDWCLVLVVVQSQLFSVRGVLCDSTAARAHCGVSLLVAEYTPPFSCNNNNVVSLSFLFS